MPQHYINLQNIHVELEDLREASYVFVARSQKIRSVDEIRLFSGLVSVKELNELLKEWETISVVIGVKSLCNSVITTTLELEDNLVMESMYRKKGFTIVADYSLHAGVCLYNERLNDSILNDGYEISVTGFIFFEIIIVMSIITALIGDNGNIAYFFLILVFFPFLQKCRLPSLYRRELKFYIKQLIRR